MKFLCQNFHYSVRTAVIIVVHFLDLEILEMPASCLTLKNSIALCENYFEQRTTKSF